MSPSGASRVARPRELRWAALMGALALLACAPGARATAPGAEPTRRLAVGRDTIAFVDEGAGPAVVLLDGGAMGLGQWDAVAATLRRAGFRVVRMDARGWGQSPLPTEPYHPAADVRALLDHLGVERANVVGASTGGGHALDLALLAPERVARLALVAPAVGGWRWSASFAARGARQLAALRAGGVDSLATVLLADPHFLPSVRADAPRSRRVRELLRAGSGVFRIDASLVRATDPPALARLGAVRAPTLVVTPLLDHPDLLAIGDTLRRAIPGARELRLPGSGHMPHLERPAALAAALVAFFREDGAR